MSEHLKTEQLELYAARQQGAARLAPADLLSVDEHLATCAECRGKALLASGLEGSEADLRAFFVPGNTSPSSCKGEGALDDHLEHELLAGYVDGTLGDVDKEIVEGHLEFCASCAEEVVELRSFQSMIADSAEKEYAPDPAAGLFQRMDAATPLPQADLPPTPSLKGRGTESVPQAVSRRPVFRFAPAFAMAAAVIVAVIAVAHFRSTSGGEQVAEAPRPSVVAPSPEPVPAPSAASSEPEKPAASPKSTGASIWNGAGNIGSSQTPSTPSSGETGRVGRSENPSTTALKTEATAPGSSGSPSTPPQVHGAVSEMKPPVLNSYEAPPAAPSSIEREPLSIHANAPIGNGVGSGALKSTFVVPPPAPTAVVPAPAPVPLMRPNGNIAMARPMTKAPATLPDAVKKVLGAGHLDLDTPEIHELTTVDVSDNLGATPASFSVTSPVSTALLSDRPVFTWEQAKEAVGYQVSVIDDTGTTVDTSPSVQTTFWKADKPLPTGELLRWQVTATESGQTSETAPVGGAKFRVLDPDRAAQIEDAQKTFSDQPLALGILYAQAGMLDEAERAFEKAQKDDPTNSMAPKLLADVKAVRQNSAL